MKTYISKKACDSYLKVFNIVEGVVKNNHDLDGIYKKAFNPFGFLRGIRLSRALKSVKQMAPEFEQFSKAMSGATKLDPTKAKSFVTAARKQIGKGIFQEASPLFEERMKILKDIESAATPHVRQQHLERLMTLDEQIRQRFGKGGISLAEEYARLSPEYREYITRGGRFVEPAQAATTEAVGAAEAAGEAGAQDLASAVAEGTSQVARQTPWYTNPWVAGIIGAGAIGVPGTLLAANIIADKARREGRRAALAAGGAGLATGILAGRIIPTVGERLMNIGAGLAQFNAPRPIIMPTMYPYY
ncbi:MAG: hypothetical protein ABIM30_00345 [candidate division WOR-3 bacterium]